MSATSSTNADRRAAPAPAPVAVAPSPLAHIGLLCRTNARMAVTKARDIGRHSKLLLVTVVGFAAAYLALGYVLFEHGLHFLSRLPGIGTLASERILFLLYFFFFVMLIFSNAVIGYASLFRNKTTGWLLTLPIDHRSVFGYRVIETLVFSSWGLVFLSAPLLLAYGHTQAAPTSFYFKTLAAYLPFLVVPAGLASWFLLVVVRYLNRWWVVAAVALLVVLVLRSIAATVDATTEVVGTGASMTLTFNRVLAHTQISTAPFLPSTWMTKAMLGWSSGSHDGGAFNFLLLTSYGLMGAMLTLGAFSHGFYPSWVRSYTRRAARSVRGRTLRPAAYDRAFKPGWIAAKLPLRRSTRALVRKDGITFRREPSQWGQVAVVLSILLLYVLNLGNIGYGYDSPFWTVVISYLNLGVCALALATLTTRFVFPQFSLEGQRLWILGLAPIRIESVITQKFLLAFALTGSTTLALIFLSGQMLGLPPGRTAAFMGTIACMAFTLTALAVGIGALFPNLRETNPAKIVSGFGGTLCLILSFVYIVGTVACLVASEARTIKDLDRDGTDETPYDLPAIKPAALGAVCAFSLATGLTPLLLARNRVKRLDFFAKI